MLRIITGEWRGRKIDVPGVKTTRPTSDRVRESLFNLLESRIAQDGLALSDMMVLDAFAGSGSLGLEALSRGAKHVTFFEQNPKAFSIVNQNIRSLGIPLDRVKNLRLDATKPVKTDAPCDLVFLDPPYGKSLVHFCVRALRTKGWVGPSTLIVAEMAVDDELPEAYQQFSLDCRVYGTTKIVLLRGLSSH